MPKSLQENETVPHQLKRPPWIYLLFLFSGIASLIYLIVWVRMLTLVFGHTIYSVSIVLSAFMAGLGLGSYLWGRTIDKTGKPLLVYGKIEILILIISKKQLEYGLASPQHKRILKRFCSGQKNLSKIVSV